MSLLLPILAGIQLALAPAGQEGKVVAAPHGAYDQYTDRIAQAAARELNYGWVVARGYRSVPFRHWFDVNRPTERAFALGSFQESEVSHDGELVYEDYQRQLDRASRVPNGRLKFLVEVHGHARKETLGGQRVSIQTIEMATSGFTVAALRRIQERYQRLIQSLPASLRVPLKIDRLDPTYDYRGHRVRFYFTALGAKREGSLRPEKAERGLHLELPPALRDTARGRQIASAIVVAVTRAAEE
ncbi:MAG: hypothetical protein R3F62_05625 [Planctomycetota bacterium]